MQKTMQKKALQQNKPINALHCPWQVRCSMLVMGLGQLCYGQIVKGLFFLGVEAGMLYFFITQGFRDIEGFFTLGTVLGNPWLGTQSDDSMKMLILGIFAILLLIFLIILYIVNVRDALFTAREKAAGRGVRHIGRTLDAMADEKFHVTALSLPVVSVMIFSILPIVFMILLAFTNLGGNIMYPTALADWSFSAWEKIFSLGQVGDTFFKILSWNVLWAVMATAVNFFGGLALALLLNKKNVIGKKIWRAFPVLAYAVPGFISMVGFKFMFSQSGPINYLIKAAGHDAVFFLINDPSAKWWARGIGLFVNAWISIPSVMLMATGILGNINPDLYEAADIDGASALQKFFRITLPFVVFSITPVLISMFVGSFNNFGIFFFLRSGITSNGYFLASDTDLLINWLYGLSVDNNYYSVGAAISLIIFLITGGLSLAVYVRTAAYKQEDTFQ